MEVGLSGPLRVYSFVPKRNNNASFYYRLQVPLETMERMGLKVECILDDNDPSVPNTQRVIAMTTCDVNVFYQAVSEHLLENILRVQQFLPAKHDGEWKWPPSWVLDTDDNLFMVHPQNPAFKDLGIRSPDGTPLKPGDELGYVDDATGERRAMWMDGKNGFDIARNLNKLDVYRRTGQAVDAMTTSSPLTADYVRAEINPHDVFVFPNSVRFDHYEKVELAHHDEIRVLWQGSPTHFEDMYPLKDAFSYLSHKYPHVKWIFWGVNYPWAAEAIPSEQYRFIPWCPYEEYRLRLATIGHDIAIAPLLDHKFNQSRSAIKFYESAVLQRPAAFVGQRSGPYRAEIIDGETGLLFDDTEGFIKQMSLMIEDSALRTRIAGNAKDWVSDNRDAFKTVPKLYEFYQGLRERKKAEVPPPTEDEWAAHVARLDALEDRQLEKAS